MREIEMMFALRHPNILGLYAWYHVPGNVPQVGMVVELAGSDLLETYRKDDFTFQRGLEIVVGPCAVSSHVFCDCHPSPEPLNPKVTFKHTGATRGLAHMHSMPVAVIVSRAEREDNLNRK